ncbi:MAG: hypothetical protein GX627_03250 [Parcubacteria group bacterium]|nr:hypothetical protein [Parcubacteria group bacterium]
MKNEYYHLFNKGVDGKDIFIDDQDKARFIFLITHLQSPARVLNVSWYTKNFIKKNSFKINNNKIQEILKNRSVELMAFVIIPNGFHLLVKNKKDDILSVYMHRVLTAYGKYFNAKYNKKGHVFDGPFKAKRVKDGDQLLRLSALIHKDPNNIEEWRNNYDKYPWSSFQDYISSNRWDDLISIDLILQKFKNQTEYKKFVLTSTIKEENNV